MAKDITILLRSLGYLEYFIDDSLSMNNDVRSVQRYLACKGFSRGAKKGSQHYRLKAHILEKRNEYVWRMMKETVARKCSILCMDESYIHKNYCRHEDSLYYQNDEQDLTTITHYKGQHYCFIAAIVDADHSVP